jgi:hypothetical protein
LTQLSLEEGWTLLGVQDLPGTAGQLEGLRRWIEGILSIIIDRAQRFHQSEIRNLKSQIITRDEIGIKTG